MSACLPEAECQVALAEADGGVRGIELVRAHEATIVVHLAAANGLLTASKCSYSCSYSATLPEQYYSSHEAWSLIRTPTAHLLSCAQEWPSTASHTAETILHTPCNGSLSCWIPGLPVHCQQLPAASAGFRRKLRWPQKQGPASQVGSQQEQTKTSAGEMQMWMSTRRMTSVVS